MAQTLRSPGSIYREAISQGLRPEQADQMFSDYLSQTRVILRNAGDTEFAGAIATCDGVEYRLAPKHEREVPLGVAVFFLGDWSLQPPLRQLEHERLAMRYAGFSQIDARDLELYNLSLRTYRELAESQAVSAVDRKRAKQLVRPLPAPSAIPKLEVLDVETRQVIDVPWPLYDADSTYEEFEPEEALSRRVEELETRLAQLQAQAAKKVVVDTLEAEDE